MVDLTPAITAHLPRGLGPGVGVTTAIIIGVVLLRDTVGPFRRTLTAGLMLHRRPRPPVRGGATANIEKSRARRPARDEPLCLACKKARQVSCRCPVSLAG